MSESSSNSDLGIGMLVSCRKFLENLGKLKSRLIDGVIQNRADRFLGVRGGWGGLGGFLLKSTRTPKGSGSRSPRSAPGKQPDRRQCFYWDTTS